MRNTLPKKIKDAIKAGELIPFDTIRKTWSPEKRARVAARARYIRAAMELRALRERSRLSQSDLAKRMGVKREFISRIESGEQNVTLDTLYRIGEAVGKEVVVQFR
jgi:HTH-type transcriptional regulator/antitoxin HipB